MFKKIQKNLENKIYMYNNIGKRYKILENFSSVLENFVKFRKSLKLSRR